MCVRVCARVCVGSFYERYLLTIRLMREISSSNLVMKCYDSLSSVLFLNVCARVIINMQVFNWKWYVNNQIRRFHGIKIVYTTIKLHIILHNNYGMKYIWKEKVYFFERTILILKENKDMLWFPSIWYQGIPNIHVIYVCRKLIF